MPGSIGSILPYRCDKGWNESNNIYPICLGFSKNNVRKCYGANLLFDVADCAWLHMKRLLYITDARYCFDLRFRYVGNELSQKQQEKKCDWRLFTLSSNSNKTTIMRKEIIFMLLPHYADWESAFIASSLNQLVKDGESKYVVKTASVTKLPILSMGGFKTLPDYDLTEIPDDYEALILIGGLSWFTEQAKMLVPIVQKAIYNHILVAGICNATVFLGKYGFLNQVRHTSNTLEYLLIHAGDNYSNKINYVARQVVCDQGIITANGTAYLEFCRAILLQLDADTPENIDSAYKFHKAGLYAE